MDWAAVLRARGKSELKQLPLTTRLLARSCSSHGFLEASRVASSTSMHFCKQLT